MDTRQVYLETLGQPTDKRERVSTHLTRQPHLDDGGHATTELLLARIF